MTKLDTKLRTIGGGWVGEQPNIAHVDFASDHMQHTAAFYLRRKEPKSTSQQKVLNTLSKTWQDNKYKYNSAIKCHTINCCMAEACVNLNQCTLMLSFMLVFVFTFAFVLGVGWPSSCIRMSACICIRICRVFVFVECLYL